LVGTNEKLLLRVIHFDTKKIMGMGGARRKTLMHHAQNKPAVETLQGKQNSMVWSLRDSHPKLRARW
jgi:hypothetical protein